MTSIFASNAWIDCEVLDSSQLTQREQSWLLNQQSSSVQLRAATNQQIRLHPLQEYHGYPIVEEAQFLQIPDQDTVWIREIRWQYQQQVWMVARMVVPSATFRQQESLFTGLGQQAIGDTLFRQPNPRKKMQLAHLSVKHDYHRIAKLYIDVADQPVWMRRSIFHLGDAQALMVAEVFLPPIFT